MKRIMIVLLLLLVGCGKGMTTKEIADEVNFCIDNGLMDYAVYDIYGTSITKIICIPLPGGK